MEGSVLFVSGQKALCCGQIPSLRSSWLSPDVAEFSIPKQGLVISSYDSLESVITVHYQIDRAGPVLAAPPAAKIMDAGVRNPCCH